MAETKGPASKSKKGASGAGAENISGYWRDFFDKHPELLAVRENDVPVAKWREDHGGMEMPENVMNGLTNVKSLLRKKAGIKTKKRRGRPRKEVAATTVVVAVPAARVVKAPSKLLEALEDQIDTCIGLTTGHAELAKIVQALKHARRLTIFQMGE